jgi:hypothetical protein
MTDILSFKTSELNDMLFEVEGGGFQLYGWLTEEHLKRICIHIFGESELVFNKTIPGIYGKPDIYIPKHNLIIEYDGTYHYTNSETIERDERKDASAKATGIKVLRVPYFVQMQWSDLEPYLDQDLLTVNPANGFNLNYPNGFIHHGCVLPTDFCEVGLVKFKEDLVRFQSKSNEILYSLYVHKRGEKSLPPSLRSLLSKKRFKDLSTYSIDTWQVIFNKILTKNTRITEIILDTLDVRLIKMVNNREWDYDMSTIDNCFYQSYQMLGGKKSKVQYDAARKLFETMTLKEFTGGPIVLGRDYSMKMMQCYLGSHAETERMFHSLDSVVAYT